MWKLRLNSVKLNLVPSVHPTHPRAHSVVLETACCKRQLAIQIPIRPNHREKEGHNPQTPRLRGSS